MRLKLSAILLLFLASALPVYAQNEYFLPQIANGTYSGGSFRVTFVVVNNSDQSAIVAIQLTDDLGLPMAVTIPGFGTQSTIALNLPAGASRLLQTDGSGELKAGAARITSTAPIGVSAVFAVYDSSGNFQTEAGVGSSTPASEFVIPVDTTGDFNTGFALFNQGQQNASLTFSLYSLAGNPSGSTTLTLNATRHLAQFVAGAGQLFPASTGFRGTLVVTSTTPITAVTLRQNGNPLSYTSLPAVARTAGKNQIYLSHVANGIYSGGRFRTTFLLFNMSLSSAAAGALTLTQDNGSPLQVTITGQGTSSTFPFNLAPRAAVFLETDGLGTLAGGAASIISSGPIGACAIFTILDSQGRFTTEAGVGDSPLMTELTLPVDIGGGLDTGVAFFNPGLSAINLAFTLFGEGGVSVGTAQLSLGPRNHVARFVSELFAGQSNFRGSMAVSSAASGVSAITLRQKETPLNYTTLPVTTGMKHGETPAAGALLSKTRTGVTATSDTTVSDTLPAGFKLSGSIQGSGMPMAVLARAGNGTLYSGSVNFLSQRYLVVVPAGTYQLMVCYMPQSALGELISTYQDPTTVQVAADTTRNIVLPAVTVFQVTGSVSGLSGIPAAISDTILYLTSADRMHQGFVELQTGGLFQGHLPNGSYTASLAVANIQHTATQEQLLTLENIGSLTVNSAPVSKAFSVPATAKFSGTVRVNGLSVLPDSTSVTAMDLTTPVDPNSFTCAFVAGVGNVSVDPAGPYQLIMATGRNYSLNVQLPVKQGSTSIGTAWYPTTGLQQVLSGNQTLDFNVPTFPGVVTISGTVTNGSGQGLANIGVTASSQQLTGAMSVGFSAAATTDSNGRYSMVVLSGIEYTINFVPPTPQP